MQIVYIMGLGHSGSTLLDLMLSGHSLITGAGEIAMMTNPKQRLRRLNQMESKECSCGESLSKCEFWGKVVNTLIQQPDLDQEEALGLVVSNAESLLGEGTWLSDSSKNHEGLSAYLGLQRTIGGLSLKIIHLSRDARSWGASQLNRSGSRGVIPALRVLRFWKKSTQDILAILDASNVEFLSVGYEELCFFPMETLQTICEFLGLSFEEEMLRPMGAHAHVATGNPMRIDQSKNNRILYDHRWFFRRDLNTAYWVVPGLKRINSSFTYPLTNGLINDASFRPPMVSYRRNSMR